MTVLFCTNLPSPYRVDFFNELGKYCDLTVCYERRTASDRDQKWQGASAQSYEEVYLDLVPVGTDQSRGSALRKYIASHPCDRLILTNYVSPATMEAIVYCKLKQIPYWIEYDGGFNKLDPLPKRLLKKFLLCGAEGHLTTCDEHITYLQGLGIEKDRIYIYPFTSVTESDLENAIVLSKEDKEVIKQELGMTESRILLSVGRFSYDGGYGKGYDTLMTAAEQLPPSIGIYIVGDEPTQEFLEWKQRKQLSHVHFVGFKQKQELAHYYAASDAFILLSRGDIWGLVINEAMSFGLPVITTEQCMAGVELVTNDVNGFLLDAGDEDSVIQRISELFVSDEKLKWMGIESRKTVSQYTIDNMAKRHIEIFKGIINQ